MSVTTGYVRYYTGLSLIGKLGNLNLLIWATLDGASKLIAMVTGVMNWYSSHIVNKDYIISIKYHVACS